MQTTGVYKVDEVEQPKRHRKLKRLIIVLIFLLIVGGLFLYIRSQLKPHTVIKQAGAKTTKVSFDQSNKAYDEGDFTVNIPTTWKTVPRPPEGFQTWTWQTSENGTNGEQLTIYEDTIPGTYAVNRELAIHAEGDHVSADGVASDNCSKYTLGEPLVGQFGAPAKWQGVEFLCDQENQYRDVLGTSSPDGINTVIVKSPNSGLSHKFFFVMINQNYADPDYSTFYSAISSFHVN